MIRFCDKEVYCMNENELDRQYLISYFFSGHLKEIVCVLNEEGRFLGSITYDSLLGKDLKDAIIKDFVILDEHIWENGRKFFKNIKKDFGCTEVLPVLDQKHRLYAFIWQDYEANREIRMLEELMECQNALTFKDVYPDFDCVTVQGCNELSYYFVQYLKKIEMPVNVRGGVWKEFGVWNDEEVLDYRNFIVYGEGIVPHSEKIEYRDSVSTEFECINQIYEENIRRKNIRDTNGSFDDLLLELREKNIAILGTGENALNAYDLLLENGLDICCFVSDEDREHFTFMIGKEIKGRERVIEDYEQPVFIDPDYKHSAFGFGWVDIYHYYGCKRNSRLFLLQDYTEIPKTGLRNLLRYILTQQKKRLVLVGDYWLCLKLKLLLDDLVPDSQDKVFYCEILNKTIEEKKQVKWLKKEELSTEDICLILMPEFYGQIEGGITTKQIIHDKILKKLMKVGIVDIADYFIENDLFMDHNRCHIDQEFKVSKIVLGAIDYHSGNILFRQILDNHPDVLMINYGYLNDNLFFICERLSMEKGSDIMPLFWQFCNEEGGIDSKTGILHSYQPVFWKVYGEDEKNSEKKERVEDEISEFHKIMNEMLTKKEMFSSQELFVMFHIAYAKILGREVKKSSEIIIYWEPHEVSREVCERYSLWLKKAADSVYIINLVRNAYQCIGSGLNYYKEKKIFSYSGKQVFRWMFRTMYMPKKEYNWAKRIIIKFEDLKCRSEQELEKLCNELEMVWSETLLETTENGRKCIFNGVTGFDPAPVYRTYEEYFSTYDRFRILLLTASYQKKYGYPYIRSSDFSRRELKEAFSKDFRVEKRLVFQSDENRRNFRKWVQNLASGILWEVRCMEFLEEE